MKSVIKVIKELVVLSKAYALFCVVISVGIPIYVFYALEEMEMPGFIVTYNFLAAPSFMFFMFFGKVDLVEDKCKQTTYMFLTRINRNHYVIAKYVLALAIFGISMGGYYIAKVFVNDLPSVLSSGLLYDALFYAVFTGVYLLIELKFGYEAVKFYPIVMFLLASFGGAMLGKLIIQLFDEESFAFFDNMSVIALVASVIIYAVSFLLSRSIYEKKDL